MNNEQLVTDPQFWNQKYIKCYTSWDLKGPTPYFARWIMKQESSQNICILGSGNGYDALHFSFLGHTVTAVDFADEPINYMRKTSKELSIPLHIIQDDIFNLSNQFSDEFDFVIEQTCFCAINPSMRINYIKMVHTILKERGKFVGFLFPIKKEESEGGPPFAVNLGKTLDLFEKYFNIESQIFPEESISHRKGNEVFVEMKKII